MFVWPSIFIISFYIYHKLDEWKWHISRKLLDQTKPPFSQLINLLYVIIFRVTVLCFRYSLKFSFFLALFQIKLAGVGYTSERQRVIGTQDLGDAGI